jgi:hypothetical protein
MLKIQSGRAHNHGIRYWEIVDPQGVRLTEFDSRQFDTIANNTPVYFIDLDVDPTFCENVQSVYDVDDYVSSATPTGGIDTDAEPPLRLYIMSALLTALGKQGIARQTYLQQLRAKMLAVAAGAGQPANRVTLAQLKTMGIAD